MAHLEVLLNHGVLAILESERTIRVVPELQGLKEIIEKEKKFYSRLEEEFRAFEDESKRSQIKNIQWELESAVGEERKQNEATAYHEQLKRQFERAAWRPWLPLPDDHQSDTEATLRTRER